MASNDNVIAKPPGECCLRGTIHEGKPKGKIISINGVDTYVAEPSSDKANGHVVMVGGCTKATSEFHFSNDVAVFSGCVRYDGFMETWIIEAVTNARCSVKAITTIPSS